MNLNTKGDAFRASFFVVAPSTGCLLLHLTKFRVNIQNLLFLGQY